MENAIFFSIIKIVTSTNFKRTIKTDIRNVLENGECRQEIDSKLTQDAHFTNFLSILFFLPFFKPL